MAFKKTQKEEWIDLVDPLEVTVQETETLTRKIVLRVVKLGKDGEPRLDIRTWEENEKTEYKGFTTKGINIDYEWAYDLQELLDRIIHDTDTALTPPQKEEPKKKVKKTA